MNLLITSVGRRSYLVEYFREAWQGVGEIHAANSHADASGLYFADKQVITPGIYDSEYVDFLVDYCKANHIKALLPLFDLDLAILAQHKEVFKKEGIQAIVSDPDVIRKCNDKWESLAFLQQSGLNVPLSFLNITETKEALEKGTLTFPLVLKPRWGMGSIGIYIVEDIEELEFYYNRILREISRTYLQHESRQTPENQVLIQEFIKGREYGLDIVNDLDGNYITCFVKEKIAMRSGETDIARTVDSKELRELGAALSRQLGHIGNLDIDILERDGKYYILEMNARFGGGYPFSHLAGARLPEAILYWLQQQKAPDHLFHIEFETTGFKLIQPFKVS